jgi:hypothetical protein
LGRIQRLLARRTGINLNAIIEKIIGFSFTFLNDSNSIATAVQKEKMYIPDLVITLSQAASFRPHHALLKLPILHTKWMAYIHDPYPFHLYPRPYQFYQDGYSQKENFFKKISQTAQYFAFPSQLLMEWMAYTFPPMIERGIIIPHQLNSVMPNYVNIDKYLDIKKFNIVHAGNITFARPPHFLLKAFQQFLVKTPEAKNHIVLHLIGPSDYTANELAEISGNIPEVICSLQSIPFNIAFWIQQHASVNLIIEANSYISPFLPGKFPNCVQANKPILLLSPYYSEMRRLLGNDYEYWSETNNTLKIEALISKLYECWLNNKNIELSKFSELSEYLSDKNLASVIHKLDS